MKIHHSEMNHRNFMVLVKCCCLETQVGICHWRTTKNSSSDISFGMKSWRQHSCTGRFINFKITGSQVDLAAMGFLTASRSFSIMTWGQDAEKLSVGGKPKCNKNKKNKKVACNETNSQELSVMKSTWDYTRPCKNLFHTSAHTSVSSIRWSPPLN